MPPILFRLKQPLALGKGVGPLMPWNTPTVQPTILTIAGVTKDETGAAAGGFTVYLFDMTSGVPVLSQQTISDGSGNYSFSVGRGGYWAVDYRVGTPDKGGVSVNPITGV